MGALIGEDDVHIPALFALMSERFAPSREKEASKKDKGTRLDGIKEMADFQRKFDIFRTEKGAPTLRDCAALLNLGGSVIFHLRWKWYEYLDWVHYDCKSDDPEKTGGERIIAKLRDNLIGIADPKPVVFMPYHDRDRSKMVLIEERNEFENPAFYIKVKYTLIKLPMYHEQ